MTPSLIDPLSNAKTVCHLCGKPHLHGPFDRERQLRVNRWHRWERVKNVLWYFPVPVIFLSVITLGAIFSPRSQPPTPEEERQALRDKQRVEQIDRLMDSLQDERDELDPPQEEDPPSPF